MLPTKTQILDRFNGNIPAAVEWMETERAQALYMAHNSRYAPTVAISNDIAERLSILIDELQVPPLPTVPRVAYAIAIIGTLATLACYVPAAVAAEPQVKILAIDSNGEGWLAGSGDDCESAMVAAVFPKDTQAVECIEPSSPLWAE